uniref:Kazal-like domain-containing protein n=1 Tax=Meloidogyne javanica TaxID=6303 RepID=A0A915MPZ7_MELJA
VGPALSSLYIGIFYAFVVFGPAIGFFMSSKFLLWHTDFMVTGQRLQKLYLYMMIYKIIVNFRIIDLDETDPKWVGAWYIGFILAAIFGLLAVFPILTFPKLLPESLKWHRTRLQEETMGTKKRTPECCGIPPSSSRTAAILTADGEMHDDDFCGGPVVVELQSSMPALKNRQGPIWYQLCSSSNHYDPLTDTYVYKLNTRCNSNCQCSMLEYHPVCAENIDGSQLAFYSPCFAGCTKPYSSSEREYFNCSCVPDETKGGVRRVKRGFCESKCRGLFAFLVTVDYDERSFALGIQWILVRIIGTIPAPVVFGWLFDHSCIRQHLDPCSGEHGSCMLHHNKTLADLFLTFTVAGLLVGLISLISVLMFFANSLHDESNIAPATVSSRLKTEKRMSALLSAENGEQHINDGD